MEDRKPIKRSEQLAPLSREHHEGLLYGWKIKQGISFGTEVKVMADYTSWFWDNHLKQHFMAEEAAFSQKLFANDDMVERMKEEHQEIEGLIHINENIADINLLKQLSEKLNDHIRFEERELFPYVEQKISTQELDEIAAQLAKAEKGTSTWQNEFWIKKK